MIFPPSVARRSAAPSAGGENTARSQVSAAEPCSRRSRAPGAACSSYPRKAAVPASSSSDAGPGSREQGIPRPRGPHCPVKRMVTRRARHPRIRRVASTAPPISRVIQASSRLLELHQWWDVTHARRPRVKTLVLDISSSQVRDRPRPVRRYAGNINAALAKLHDASSGGSCDAQGASPGRLIHCGGEQDGPRQYCKGDAKRDGSGARPLEHRQDECP